MKTMKTKNIIIALLGVALVTSIAFNVNYNNKIEKVQCEVDTLTAIKKFTKHKLGEILTSVRKCKELGEDAKDVFNGTFAYDAICLYSNDYEEKLDKINGLVNTIDHYARIDKAGAMKYKEKMDELEELEDELGKHYDDGKHRNERDCKVNDCKYYQKFERCCEIDDYLSNL